MTDQPNPTFQALMAEEQETREGLAAEFAQAALDLADDRRHQEAQERFDREEAEGAMLEALDNARAEEWSHPEIVEAMLANLAERGLSIVRKPW